VAPDAEAWLSPGCQAHPASCPPSRDILNHPGMAYIPAVAWIHGEDYEPRQNRRPFWIDIRPPTVCEYIPIAERLLERGLLQQENSFVQTARQQSSAIDATGVGQLRSLNKNLGDILGVVAQGTSTDVSAPGDIVAGAATLPCDRCPAPMTLHEAEVLH
jgi:hypothetical protein